MGLSFKIAPGVRIRAGKRGIGASVGPRAARVHLNPGGRVGFSSGVGPVTVSASAGRRPARRAVGYPQTVAGQRRSGGVSIAAQAIMLPIGAAFWVSGIFAHTAEDRLGSMAIGAMLLASTIVVGLVYQRR